MRINLFAILLALLAIACSSTKRPSGFEMQNEIYATFSSLDSSKKMPYLSSTIPIDSADPSKIAIDVYRAETKNYPDTIKIFARVFDSLGHFITNIANPYNKSGINYFNKIDEKLGKVYKTRTENIPQYTVREFGKGDSIPYQVVLNLDYSGSMINVKDAMAEATNMFINEKYPYDNLAITTFNKYFDVKVRMTNNKENLLKLFNAKKDSGFRAMSAVGDAVWNCFDMFNVADTVAPRVLVVFSDGDDNYSKHKIGDIIKKAQDLDVHIFAIAFGYSKDENLNYMAKYTGGKFYKAKSKEELQAIFKEIYLSLRNYYLITYKPPKFWGLHQAFIDLKLPNKDSILTAKYDYDTGDLFPWDDIEKSFTRPILFEFNKSDLLTESESIIDEIVDAMMSKPSIRLEVQGHTDNVGTQEFNQPLSEKRAEAVMAAILKRGIEKERLRSRGFGFSQPVAPNTTEEGRAKNRRTVFKVLMK